MLMDISQEPLTDSQAAYVQRIFQSGKHLLGLVNSVIEVARLEAGDLSLEPQPFHLADWLQRALNDIAPYVEEKHLTLKAKVDSRLPETIVGDQKLLLDILKGLLSNAAKYTDDGEVNVELRRTSSQSWLIEVSDTGIGINDEMQAALFDLFRQGDGSYTRRHGGLGIGLNLVRKLTTLMGGQVTFHSEVGTGTVFHVALPLVEG
jgi:signal transduction histidine kinase